LEPFQGFPDQPLSLADQVAAAATAGVSRIVQCGCDLAAARWTVDVAIRHPAVVGAIAIHPNDAARLATAGGFSPAVAEIAELARANPRIRAIGETGLDYYRTAGDGRQAQIDAFRQHISLAKELGLALQIHDREAHHDVVSLLEADGAPERTVFHCFSGDRELARLAGQRGWYCSFAGTVTFASAGELRLAVSELPPELILAETDSPYLTPHPFRGRPNAPYMTALTINTLAQAMAMTLEEACLQIQSNTTAVYGQW
jgi:TatD DNase family protein